MSDDVVIVTELDAAHSIRNACRRLGCTFEDLHAMHETGDYPSVRHKIAWYALSPYYDDRDRYMSLLEKQ